MATLTCGYGFDQEGLTLAWCVMAYGFAAAILPVWLLLAPRDYLSTYMKLGTITLLAVAIILLRPEGKDARDNPVYRRHRADFRRQIIPVRVHYDCLRGRFPVSIP